MDQRRAAAALIALAACFVCSAAAPTSSNQTALDLYDGPVEGCYYNFQHYREGDRIMTNEPCLNCTCHNRMLMCYLRVCPFTKAIGQDCTVEKRADQCCPIVTCPDVPVDLLTSTSTTSPAEYGATGVGHPDKYGCSINGKYFPEGSKVPPAPNKPCEHCYCIRNMTTCVMQECTLHVDGCTPIYHKDVCCPIRYSCDHEDEIPLLDDMTTTVRPTPGFLLTTTTMMPVTQPSQDCIHDDQVFKDGALIKTEKACEHCYCMKGDIVCVVQECGTPMENEGKNCTSLPPRQGQCCPDTYICEGDELPTTGTYDDITTLTPPRRVGVEGSGYRNEPDESYTEIPSLETEMEGSGDDQIMTTLENAYTTTSSKDIPEVTSEIIQQYSTQPDKELNTVPDTQFENDSKETQTVMPTTIAIETPSFTTEQETIVTPMKDRTTQIMKETTGISEITNTKEVEGTTTIFDITTKSSIGISTLDNMTPLDEGFILATKLPDSSESHDLQTDEEITTMNPLEIQGSSEDKNEQTTPKIVSEEYTTIATTAITEGIKEKETTPINIAENEIIEDITSGRIPGEGDCLLNRVTYKNNSIVPSTSKCQTNCKCISSIIKCEPIICTPPLEYMENMNDCHPVYDSPDSCCPTYVCNTKETIAPESHSQMSGTEAPIPTMECSGDECRLKDENKPSISEEKLSTNECGENGCKDTAPPEQHSDECINGKCDISSSQTPEITDTKEQEPCNSETGCQAPAVKPCDGSQCLLDSEISTQQETQVTDRPTEEKLPEGDEIVCKEENCRRKEVTGTEQKPECSGIDCLQKDIISLPIEPEITTQTSQSNELTTRMDETDTTAPQQNENIFTTITEGNKLSTERTESFHEEESTSAQPQLSSTIETTHDHTIQYTQQEDISTKSSQTYEVTTENTQDIGEAEAQSTEKLFNEIDKVSTPSLPERETTIIPDFSGSTESVAPLTEKHVEYSTISPQLSTSGELNTVSNIDDRLQDINKEITTEYNEIIVTTEGTQISEDKTTATQDNEISIDLERVTNLPEATASPTIEDKSTVSVLLEEIPTSSETSPVTFENKEPITEPTVETTAPDGETTIIEYTDKSKDSSSIEPSTEYPEKEEEQLVTVSIGTSDQESQPEEKTTTYPDVSKQDEHLGQTDEPVKTTPEPTVLQQETTLADKQDITVSDNESHKTTYSSEGYTESTVSNIDEKDSENINKPTEVSHHTEDEEIKTTASIPIDIHDFASTLSDEVITEKSELQSPYPTDVGSDTKLYTVSSLDEIQATTKPDRIEQETERIYPTLSTAIDSSTISPTNDVTGLDLETTNIDNKGTENLLDVEITTTKQVDESPESRPTDEFIYPIEKDQGTTLKYDTESTKLMEEPKLPEMEVETTDAPAFNEPTQDITKITPTILEDEMKTEFITTEIPSKSTEGAFDMKESEKEQIDNIDTKTTNTASDVTEKNYASTTVKNEESEITSNVEVVSPMVDDHTTNVIGAQEPNDIDRTTISLIDKIPASSFPPSDSGITENIADLETVTLHDVKEHPQSFMTTNIIEISTERIVTEKQELAEATEIPLIKEKETEAPMSLVTSSIPQEATQSIEKVTETQDIVTDVITTPESVDLDRSTLMTEKPSILEENNKNDEIVTNEPQDTTGYNYPKPTSELPDIIKTTVNEDVTDKILSDEHTPTEKETPKQTVQYEEGSTSMMPETTPRKDEYISETYTTERSDIPNFVNTVKEEDEVTVSPVSFSSTETTEGNKNKDDSLLETSQSPQVTTESQPLTELSMESEQTTPEYVSYTTQLDTQTQTPEKDVLDVKISPETTKMPTTNESEDKFDGTTKSYDTEKPELINNEIITTQSAITEIMASHPTSTEINREASTEQPISSTIEEQVITKKPDLEVITPEDKTTVSTDVSETQTEVPEEYSTNPVEENATVKDKNLMPSKSETVSTSTEYVLVTKEITSDATTEIKSQSSETTPYSVELEEHTHQVVPDSTFIPESEISTEEPTDTKSTERGDQMFVDVSTEGSEAEKTHDVTSEISITEAPENVAVQTGQQGVDAYETTPVIDVGTQKQDTDNIENKPTMAFIPGDVLNEVTTVVADTDKPALHDSIITTEKTLEAAEEAQKQDIPVETKVPDEETVTAKSTTQELIFETTSPTPVKSTTEPEKVTEMAYTTSKPTSKPSEIQPTEEMPSPDFPTNVYDQENQETDYGEEDQAFGPGTCRYGGKVYVSAQQIPRDDPCDFCFCFRSDIICLQQSCPPPIHGCHEEPIQGFCCPRYECPVSMATTVNVTTTTTTTTTTLPPHFLPHAYKGAAQRKGCHIKGHSYKVGEVVRASSGPCLHCTCGGDGQMKCDPKACTPEPMLRQMIAAAVSAKRRR